MWDQLSCSIHSLCPEVARATVSGMLPTGTPYFSPPQSQLGSSTTLSPNAAIMGWPDSTGILTFSSGSRITHRLFLWKCIIAPKYCLQCGDSQSPCRLRSIIPATTNEFRTCFLDPCESALGSREVRTGPGRQNLEPFLLCALSVIGPALDHG